MTDAQTIERFSKLVERFSKLVEKALKLGLVVTINNGYNGFDVHYNGPPKTLVEHVNSLDDLDVYLRGFQGAQTIAAMEKSA